LYVSENHFVFTAWSSSSRLRCLITSPLDFFPVGSDGRFFQKNLFNYFDGDILFFHGYAPI